MIQASTAVAQTFSDAYGIASSRASDVGALLGGRGQGLALAVVQANPVRRSENARQDDRRLTALRGTLPEKCTQQDKAAVPCALLRATPSRAARAVSVLDGAEGD